MTLREYAFKSKAYSFSRLDKERDMYLQAWINHQVKGQKEVSKGKYISAFPTFKHFFDYEKRLQEINGKPKLTDKQRGMAQIAAMLNNKRR